jgi:coenzyme Q-binding protein COQ10
VPHFEARKRVPHGPEAMFDLVADVERYPEFLPFCESLVVKARDRDGAREVMVADMTIGYKLVRETITSRVVLDRDMMEIRADNISGPFRQMQNNWHFAPLATGGCEVRFSISYEFKSRALAVLVGGLFDKVFSRFADAFEARADVILS